MSHVSSLRRFRRKTAAQLVDTGTFLRLRPSVPKWLPEWLDAHLVVIDLDA